MRLPRCRIAWIASSKLVHGTFSRISSWLMFRVSVRLDEWRPDVDAMAETFIGIVWTVLSTSSTSRRRWRISWCVLSLSALMLL